MDADATAEQQLKPQFPPETTLSRGPVSPERKKTLDSIGEDCQTTQERSGKVRLPAPLALPAFFLGSFGDSRRGPWSGFLSGDPGWPGSFHFSRGLKPPTSAWLLCPIQHSKIEVCPQGTGSAEVVVDRRLEESPAGS